MSSHNPEVAPSPPVSSSPAKPESSVVEAEVPDEDALCGSFIEGAVSEAGDHGSRSSSPSATSEKSVDSCNTVDPSKIITNEMLEEERKLYTEGVEKEKKRKEDEAKVLNEMTDETRGLRYERLKYLLSKSTMYTEYLVERMKKQREDEEKRRERLMKRKVKKEENSESTNSVQDVQATRHSKRNGKRKDQEQDKLMSEPKNKRQKKSQGLSSPPPSFKTEEINECESPVKEHKESIEPNDKDVGEGLIEEPKLIEKASTFGIMEEEERIIDGQVVPHLQPVLMEGGVLRPYQVEGYSWLKVLYENGVNGILADEMGLGKTIQCVAILSHLVYMAVPGPFLICAPLSTIPNWFHELQRFAPKVPALLYHGHKDERAQLAKKIRRKHKIREGVFVQPVVVTSYEIAMIDRKILGNHQWKYLVVDEGHRIKNTHCRLIRELRMYRSTHRLLLTGTPLQNNLAELWSLLNFLLPEIFDDLGSFEAWFDVRCMNDADSEEKIVRQEQGENILSMLHQILSPFMLRRLKTDVDLCIPPKKEILVYAPLTKEQNKFYSALVDRTIFNCIGEKNKVEEKVELTTNGRPRRKSAKILDYSLMMETKEERRKNEISDEKMSTKRWKNLEAEEKELESWVQAVVSMKENSRDTKPEKVRSSQVTIKMRNVMMQLRKCCNHPYLLEHPLDPKTGDLALTEGVVTSSGKMQVLDRLLAELKKRGHRVLIFSQMTRMLDLIEDFCHLRDYKFCRLDGQNAVEERRESMTVFNEKNSEMFLFLLSTRAGGLGINLTGADTVIIYDSDWNPQCDLQAQDRCHRIGQTKPVVVYRFVTANTIDQKIIERAAAKRKLEKMVIHKGKFKSGNFMSQPKPISPEELRDLLNSKDHDTEVRDKNFAISQSELDLLLDRSDLFEKWEKSKHEKSSDEPKNTVLHVKGEKKTKKAKLEDGSHFFQVLDFDGDTDSCASNNNQETGTDISSPEVCTGSPSVSLV